MKKSIITIIILLLFPISVFAYSERIIPGGNTIGIDVKNNGIIVIGFYKIDNKYNINDLRVGDVIIKVGNDYVYTVNDLVSLIDSNMDNDKVKMTIKRKGEEKNLIFSLIKDGDVYKTGLYVKDSISGIGTLTYIDPGTKIYGALGHEIIEGNSMYHVEVKSGTIFESLVTSIDRSSIGSAGTKNAKFFTNNVYGNVDKNTVSGIYGKYTKDISSMETVLVGKPSEIKLKEAYIYTVLEDEKIEKFKINITSVNSTSKIKNIYFEIIDDELLEKSGGIIQGMSGSPIIQDDKIIGAVTHVIVNNPTTGYGIFITTMLNEGEK